MAIKDSPNPLAISEIVAEFGDAAGGSDSLSEYRAGGQNVPANINNIDFIEVATLGNAQDFGDLASVTGGMNNGAASPVRGVFAGGYSPSKTDTISYVQIMSKGDATDFGNLLAGNQYLTGFSNGHGGLG